MNPIFSSLVLLLVVGGDAPAPGESRTIGGKPLQERQMKDGLWVAGPCRITTPLPNGYPAPTVPGAIELKAYPAIRRAEATAGFGPELGRNLAFWKLFRHIQSHDIAMTAPVEMRFKESADESRTLEGWTMGFLYREPTMGKLGADGDVTVVDDPPLTVLSIGIQGDYSSERALAEAKTLRDELANLKGWRAIGSPRALFYNGPDTGAENRWAEIQQPVEKIPDPPAAPKKPAKKRAI